MLVAEPLEERRDRSRRPVEDGVDVPAAIGREAQHIAWQPDVVLAVGTRLQDFSTESGTVFKNPEVQLVSINAGRFDAIKRGLQKTAQALGAGVRSVLHGRTLSEELIDEVERTLVSADVGVRAAREIAREAVELGRRTA